MSIDIYGGAGSISGANNFNVDKSPLDQIGFGFGDFPAGDFLDLSFLIDILHNLTGLDFHGPGPFFISLINLIGDIAVNIADIISGVVTQLSNLTGLVFDQGPGVFIDSIINAIANVTNINLGDPSTIFASIESFLEGIVNQVSLTIEQVFVALSNLTGWNFSNGPAAFLQSVFGWLGDITDLNWTNGPLEWLNSLLAHLAQATSLDFVNGPAAFLTSLFNAVFGALDDLTGLDWTHGPAKWLASLWALLGDLTGLNWSAGPVTFVQSWLTAITNATGINLLDPSTIFDAIQEFLTNLTVNIQEVLNTIGSALGFPAPPGFDLGEIQAWIAQNVFGFIDPNRLPIIPVSHIGDTSPNLLSNPTFTDIAIFDPNTLWTLDTDVSHDNVGGSATTMATPSRQELLSADLIGVSRGQKIDVSGWVKMAAVAASQPGAVSIGVKTFATPDGSGNATDVVLASVPAYGTADWQQLLGVYEVPDGVMTLRVRLCVDENTTAGQVWFDDLWAAKQGLLPMSLVQDLIDTVSAIWQGITNAVNAAVEKIEELTGLELNSGPIKFLESLVAALSGTFATIKEVADAIGKAIDGAVIKIEQLTGLELNSGPIKFLESLIALLGGAFATAQGVADAIADAIKDFLKIKEWQLFLDNIWLSLTGKPPLPDMVISPNDAADQLALLMATTAAQATTIAQLQAAIGKPVNGIVGGDDFERSNAANLGVNWKVLDLGGLGGGGFELRNGEAKWKDAAGDQRLMLQRQGTPDAKTATPWQAITRVTGTVICEEFAGASGADHVYGRVSDDGKQYIVAWTESALVGLSVKWFVRLGYNTGSGGDKELRSVEVPRPAVGTPYTLQCGDLDGDADDQFSYRVLRGNTVVIEHTDTARVTAPMKDNRGWGFGAYARLFGLTQLTPSSVHSVTVADIRSP